MNSENKTYNEFTQTETITGVQLVLNENTGEVIEAPVKKEVHKGEHYWRFFRSKALKVFASLNNPEIDVLSFIFENTSTDDNVCNITQKRMAKKLCMSEKTVARYIRKFSDADILVKLSNGKYMINPAVTHFSYKADSSQFMALSRIYAEAKASEHKAADKGNIRTKSVKKNAAARKKKADQKGKKDESK